MKMLYNCLPAPPTGSYLPYGKTRVSARYLVNVIVSNRAETNNCYTTIFNPKFYNGKVSEYA